MASSSLPVILPTVTNPITKRQIRVGGPTYIDFMEQGGWILHEGTLQRLDLAALRDYQYQHGKQPIQLDTDERETSTGTDEIVLQDWYEITPTVASDDNVCHDDVDDSLGKQLLFVSKPSGMNCVPARDPSVDSLATQVSSLYKHAKACHRLDRDTSGIVVFGLSPEAHREVSKQFEARTTTKTYVALISGHPKESSGIIDLPIGKVKTDQGYNRWTIGGEKAREAVTEWRCDQTFEIDGAKFSRVQLTPKSGRGHQLRLHMKAIGHSILGDSLHGEGGVATCSPRLCLHAQTLQLDLYGKRIQADSVSPF